MYSYKLYLCIFFLQFIFLTKFNQISSKYMFGRFILHFTMFFHVDKIFLHGTIPLNLCVYIYM